MSILHGHRCDTCGKVDETHPDDGPPTGWWLVAEMSMPGCWELQRDFCSAHCLTGWALDD